MAVKRVVREIEEVVGKDILRDWAGLLLAVLAFATLSTVLSVLEAPIELALVLPLLVILAAILLPQITATLNRTLAFRRPRAGQADLLVERGREFWSGDKPLTDPADDRLGYAPFARHLADSISLMAPPEGLVVAIYGPWGAGKSTVLNFIINYLEGKSEENRPIIVFFNPWWFSGREDLTRQFFDQFQAVLGKWKSLAKAMRSRIADFGDLVAEVPLPYAAAGKFLTRLDPTKTDINVLKARIAGDLRKQKTKILVVIDDIDRLAPDEMREILSVIKGVADFPGVIYLLAFDNEVAIQSLKNFHGLPADEYLEKIVQVSFELPLPDKTALRSLLFDKVDAILAGTPSKLFDSVYWGNVYLDAIDHFIRTPRDAVRLANALTVTYPPVNGEVNPVDFIAIESLRVFAPLVYDTIRRNPDSFAGGHDHFYQKHGEEALKKFHESWFDAVQGDSKEPIRRLLLRLFPKLEGVWGNTFYGGADWESRWRRELRVCSPDVFPVYFRLGLPEGSLSASEMNAILSLAHDQRAFGRKLEELANQIRSDGSTRLRVFLDRLEDYLEHEISLQAIPSIIGAVFEVGDALLRPEDEGRGIVGVGNDIRLLRVVWKLLRRLPDTEKFIVLRDAISQGKAVAVIVDQISTLGQQHGKYGAKEPTPDQKKLVTAEQLQELEAIALGKIREDARNDQLLRRPDLAHILYRWRDWADAEEVKSWVAAMVADDVGLAVFLESFLRKLYSQAVTDVVGRIRFRLDPHWLQPFLQVDEIRDRVARLVERDGLAEDQRRAARQFLKEYDMREKGKDPSTPDDWDPDS